jgi:hypothetical protein
MIIILVFVIAAIFALKLYRGNFGISSPYFVMASFLLLGASIFSRMDLLQLVNASIGFLETSQILQIIAGIFLITGLYKISEARFATETFDEGVKK